MTTATARRNPGKVFVNIEDIRDCLSDYLVFDVRYNLKSKDYWKNEYAKGHAKDAIPVNLDEELCGPLVGAARHPLPPSEKFVQWCMAQGVSAGRPVLCYDDECGAMGGCRLWWMLNSLGVEAYVLNGGMQAYRMSGLPIATGDFVSKLKPSSFWPFGSAFTGCIDMVDIPANAVLADARASARFHSTVRAYGADTLPGHIEGAVNVPFMMHIIETANSKLLRDDDEIRSNLLKLLRGSWGEGEPNVSECVFYCGSGVSACINVALAVHLGLGTPKLYCGSWSEYSGTFLQPLVRHIISTHGLWLEMLSPNLGENAKVNTDMHPLHVDGTPCKVLDQEIAAAANHLHVGEKARVYFRGGRVAIIEAPNHRQ